MQLWVIRHAKSSWAEPRQPDFERPLNERGHRDGPRMAAWLSRQDHPAEWIWCSTATRALATADFVAEGFATAKPQLVADRRLYHSSVLELCEVLRETPSDIGSVAVVAHNPTLTQLVNHLAGERVLDNLPTFGVVAFAVSGSWPELAPETAQLDLTMAPKQLSS